MPSFNFKDFYDLFNYISNFKWPRFGHVYALVGVGLTLILGVLNIPNFAHGVLYALGAYLAFTIANVTGSFYFAMFLSPL